MKGLLAILALTATVAGVLGAVLEAGGSTFGPVSWTAAGLFAVAGLAQARARSAREDRRAWTYLLAAAAAWLAGQLAWDAFVIWGVPPSPNLVDAGWLAFPILAAVGTHRLVPLAQHSRTRAIAHLETLPVLIAVGTVAWAAVHNDFDASALPTAAKITALAYVMCYLALPIVMLQGLLGSPVRIRANKDLLLVLAGLAMEAAAFILWGSQLLDGTYVSGRGALDLLWTLGMLVVGMGGLAHRRPAVQTDRESRLGGLLPALTFVTVLGTLSFSAIERSHLDVRLALHAGLLAIGCALMARSVALHRDQRRLLAEQRMSHEALRKARDTSARFFELSHDLLCMASLDGRLVDTNPAWARTLGYGRDRLVGTPLAELIHPDDRARTAAAIAGLTDGMPASHAFQNRYVAADGTPRWITWSTSVDREEGLIYARGTDITARKREEVERRAAADSLARAHEALRVQADELQRSNAQLEEFAYVASHDLAEPLRSIAGFSQFLAADYGDRLDAEGREYIDFIVGGAGRMRALIDGLLEYSRVGRQRPALAPVDSAGVVDDVLEALHAAIEESGASVSRGALPVIAADRGELARVFQNLISNAIKFRAEDAPVIRVEAEPDGSMWRFSVIDNGIGVDPAYAERVFRMFKRLHTPDRYPGTGIGLTIAQRIVERHAGRMWVTPREGGGSSFNFTLDRPTEVAS